MRRRGGGEELLFLFFFWSLFKTTEICFESTKIGISTGKKHGHAREKNQETWLCPLWKMLLLIHPWSEYGFDSVQHHYTGVMGGLNGTMVKCLSTAPHAFLHFNFVLRLPSENLAWIGIWYWVTPLYWNYVHGLKQTTIVLPHILDLRVDKCRQQTGMSLCTF